MVATVVGSRLGLQQTSAWVLGSRVQIGNAALGRGGENVFVNGATGNLVVTNRDEFLIGLGPDAAIDRVYNSRGDFADDNGDNWWTSVRKVQTLTGTVNTAGSTISRRDWDGSLVVYAYDTARAAYVSREGSGAYDTLTFGTDSVLGVSAWKWQDGDTGASEIYDPSKSNQIQRSMDRDGNAVTYTYNGSGLISRITTQDGAYTDFTWSGTNLTQLSSTYYDTASSSWKSQTRTRYAYDAQNRLTSVTVDLTPGDSSITDNRTYVTSYTYEGTSKRVASITQTDGSKIEITYEPGGDYRVSSITQSVAEGVSRRTDYAYIAASGGDPARTTITDFASGLTTSVEYDAAGQLTKITQPAATAGGAAQVREFTYDAEGNVIRIKTSATSWTDYVYSDADGNGSTVDANGDGLAEDTNGLWTAQYEYTGTAGYVATRRTFNAMRAVLTETRYATLDLDGKLAAQSPAGEMTTRYVYDSENHLRFSISAAGDVTEHDYHPNGNLIRTTVYRAKYDVGALAWNAAPLETTMNNWASGLTDKSAVEITEYIYHQVTNALERTAVYSSVTSAGNADGGQPTTSTHYSYDMAGRLLSRYVTGLSGTETFVYDGLGRMVSSVDYNGTATATAFLDVSGTTVVRQANGLNQIMVYNRAGELISRSETDRSENLVNLAGWPQGAAPGGTATVPGWLNPSAYTNETQWEVVTGPDDREVVAIRSGQQTSSVNGGGNYTNLANIDPTKAYEFVFYFRKSDITQHSLYFGLQGSAAVENGTTGADNTNPYFFSAHVAAQAALFAEDRWYKVVGYVLPQGAGLVSAGTLGGVYDTTTGAKVANTTTFRWNDSLPATPQAQARFFNHLNESSLTFSTYFYQPEIRAFDADQVTNLLPATGTQYRYDMQGRLRVQIDPTGRRTHYLYDRVGRKVAEVDGDGSLVEYKYDAADRVIATVRYATRLTALQISSLSDDAGNPTAVDLDSVRPTGVSDDSWTWTVYDGAGRILRTIDSEGSTTSFTYDGASRLLTETHHGTRFSAGAINGYKTTPPNQTSGPGAGADRVTRFFHDATGRQVGSLDGEGYLKHIIYDSSGRVIGTEAFAEKVVNTTLPFEDLLAEVRSPANAADIRTWSVYDRRGFLRGTVNGEGEVTLYDYNALGQVTQVIRGRKLASPPTSQPALSVLTSAPIPSTTLGAGVLETVTYTRNNYGQVLTEARTVAAGVETITYTYDNMRRLTGVTTDVAEGDDRTVLQRYDRRGRLVGQLTAEGAVALAALGSNPTKADVDQVYRRWGVTYVYDDADRLITRIDRDGTWAAAGYKTLFFYDADGRLAYEVNPVGETVSYKYDALGRLIETREHIGRINPAGLTGGAVIAALTDQIVMSGSDRRSAIVYNTDDTVRSTTDWVADAASAPTWSNTVTTTFGYNAFSELASRTGQQGTFASSTIPTSATAYTYDKRGLLTQTVSDAGSGKLNHTVTVAYDSFGRAITVDANGQSRHMAYDRVGRVIEKTDALGNKITYGYDSRGNTVSIKDRNDKITNFRYSAFNREVLMVAPEGIQTTATYDDRGLQLTLSVDGRTESFNYDRNGNLVDLIDGLGKVTHYEYDFADRLYEVTDATGRKVRYSYDAANRRLTESRDPLGLNLTTTYAYDGLGQTWKVIDASGVQTTYKFDLLGRTTEINVDPNGLALKTVSTYDRAGNLIQLKEAAGAGAERITNFTYDNLGRMTAQENADSALNIRSEYKYDLNGNVTKRRDKVNGSTWVETRFVYNDENRLILTIDPMGGVTRTTYDKEGRVTRTLGYATALTPSHFATLTDAPTEAQITAILVTSATKDQSTAFIYDDNGRLVFTVDAIGRVSQTTYDSSDNVTRQVLYATAYTASQTPTEAQLLTWVNGNTTASDRVTRATYDDANRQTFSIDAAGQVTAYFYDDAGRSIRSIRYATLHTTAGALTMAQMESWAASNTATADRKIHLAYDAAGRATFSVDPEGYVTRTTYNGVDNTLTSTRFAPVFAVVDGVSHATLTDLVGGHEETAAKTTWHYDNAGRQYRTIDAENVETRLELDGLGQITRIRTAYGTSEEVSTTRAYDDGGRLVTEKRAFGAGDVEQTLTWTYDGLGRALTATDGKGYQTVRTYDAMGRVLTVVTPLASGVNALTQNQYDTFGNLVRVIDPVGSTKPAAEQEAWAGYFFYDLLNRLILQVDPENIATRTTYGLGGAVASVTRYVNPVTGVLTPGTQPTVATHANDATTTFTRDKLDRVTAVTDAENWTESYTLDAFGNRVSLTNRVGGTTTYTYDRRGLMLTEVLPISSVAANGTVLATAVTNTYEYDSRCNLVRTVEASNVAADKRTTNYAYDKLDRLIQKTGDAVTVTSSVDFSTSVVTPTETIIYDKRGNVIETKNAADARTLFHYDAANRKILEINALGTVRTWVYDDNNNATSSRVYKTAVALPANAGGTAPVPTGEFRETFYEYDRANRLWKTTIKDVRAGEYGAGYTLADLVTEIRYDAAGNAIQTINGRGDSTFAYYDKAGRQIASIDAENCLTTFERDPEGNVKKEVRYATRVTGAVDLANLPTANAGAGDRITEFTYDKNGRRRTEKRIGVAIYAAPPATDRLTTADSLIQYAYDGLGNVTYKIEANSDRIDYDYDVLGRLESTLTSAFMDDTSNPVRRLTTTFYDGLGNVKRVEDGKQSGLLANARVTTFNYVKGRLDSTTDGVGFTRSFGYDAMGRVTRESYVRLKSDGTTVTEGRRYGYDLLGRAVQQSSASFSSTWSFGDTREDIYNTYGEVAERRLNTVVQETFDYDNAGRLWRSTATDGVARYMLYDKAGRVSLTVTPTGAMTNYTQLETLVAWLTANGTQAIGATDPGPTAALTFNIHDKRGMMTGTREPYRELGRDPATQVVTKDTIIRSRAFNAFGEVISETDARGYTTDFTYNTMGRLIERRSPQVAYTSESGVVLNARPTEQYRHDISGRLIATRSANGFWTTRTLLANTGHGGEEAVVLAQYNPDGGEFLNYVNVFGELTLVGNGLGGYITNVYDKVGQLVERRQVGRAAGSAGNPGVTSVQLVDFYTYDGLGQRIKHTNNQFGSLAERTDYDREGRVIQHIDFDTRATSYTYTWDAALTTDGLGTFGGWVKTTTHASGKVGVEKLDSFGRLTRKTDLGGRTYVMGFDAAGRQTSQTSSAGQSLTMSWYNTGLLARQSDISGNAQTWSTSNAQADYSYDIAGQRVRERYTTTEWTYTYDPEYSYWDPYGGGYTPPTATQTTTLRQDGVATYDVLGRMTEFKDLVVSTTDPTLTQYTYDLNGNVRSTFTKYWTAEGALNTIPGYTYWYEYDSMNRFVVTERSMPTGEIFDSKQILYDAAGNRLRVMTATSVATDIVNGGYEVWTPHPGHQHEIPIEDGNGGYTNGSYQWVDTYEHRDGFSHEIYQYTADGYLAQVSLSTDVWNTTTDTVQEGPARVYSRDVRDALGRITSHKEYALAGEYVAGGSPVSSERTTTWSNAGLIQQEINFTYTNYDGGTGQDYFTTTTTTYDYRAETYAGSGVWTGAWQGVVTRIRTTSTKDTYPAGGSTTNLPSTQTTYQYTWWDTAQQAKITYDSDTGSGSNAIYTSTFGYDVNGRLSYVNIKDGRPRNVTFVTDANGQVLSRKEADNLSYGDPWDRYYYFSGVRIGEITNNGGGDEYNYISAVNNRVKPPAGGTSTPFHGGNYGGWSADFDQAYQALTPGSIRGAGQAWTIRTGDTLQSIAAAIWGDSSLWYLIAEHNGLTADSLLSAGQSIVVPAKVGNLHNTADTFRPYDPNKAIGDVNPTQPAPPKKPGGCGTIGTIIAVIIAVAVAAIVAPYAAAALANSFGGATVAAGSTFTTAAGSTLAAGSSVTGVATAAGVASGTITVSGGVAFAAGALAGAAASVASQAFLMATGAQDQFDWKGLAMSALSGGVGGGVGKIAGLGNVANQAMGNFARGVARGAISSVITQGVAVATGLQHKFNWGNVAVAAVASGVSSGVGTALDPEGTVSALSMEGIANSAVSGLAGGIAGAAVRTAIDGGSFGDNILATLPDVIGSTIGQALGAALGPKMSPVEKQAALQAKAEAEAGVVLGASANQQMVPASGPELDVEALLRGGFLGLPGTMMIYAGSAEGGINDELAFSPTRATLVLPDGREIDMTVTPMANDGVQFDFPGQNIPPIARGLYASEQDLFELVPAWNVRVGETYTATGPYESNGMGWRPKDGMGYGKFLSYTNMIGTDVQTALNARDAAAARAGQQRQAPPPSPPPSSGDAQVGTGGSAAAAATGSQLQANAAGSGATPGVGQAPTLGEAARSNAAAAIGSGSGVSRAVREAGTGGNAPTGRGRGWLDQIGAAVGDAVAGAVAGDLHKPRGLAGHVGQFLGGLNPLADVRDLGIALYQVSRGEKGAWVNLAAAGIGFIPIAGDGLKQVIKHRELIGSAGGAVVRNLAEEVSALRRMGDAQRARAASTRAGRIQELAAANAQRRGGIYRVGAYDEIKGTVPGLDAHHVGQKALMGRMIPGYDPLSAPAILVPKVGHTIRGPRGIVSRSTAGLETPRAVVARDIMELRRVYPDIPNAQLQQLIRSNRTAYPQSFTKGN